MEPATIHSTQALARVPMPTTISPMEEPVLTRATFSSKQNYFFFGLVVVSSQSSVFFFFGGG